MGRRETSGFRGYLVRVQTKEGRVFRHRKLRLVLDKSRSQGLSLQTRRLGEFAHSIDSKDVQGVTPDTSDHDSLRKGLSVLTWRSYYNKDGKRAGGHRLCRAPVVEESTIDDFMRLARVRTKLPGEPGEPGVRGVEVVSQGDEDDAQVARLYQLGILYDDGLSPNKTAEAATDKQTGPYQADSLDTIPHAEPLYSVRHVVSKRRGRRTSAGASTAETPPETAGRKPDLAETATPPASKKISGPAKGEGPDGFGSGDLPLFALDGVWEDGEGQTIEGRDLWRGLQELEYEYVVLRDDDLASLAGSWVELESVLGTDDGE